MTLYYLVLLAILNWVVYSFAVEYRRSEATGFQRVLDAAKGSATILWSKFVVLVGALSSILMGAADTLNMPEIKMTIEKYLTPEHMALVLVGVAVITQWARQRTLED
jgi:hypothetical protein